MRLSLLKRSSREASFLLYDGNPPEIHPANRLVGSLSRGSYWPMTLWRSFLRSHWQTKAREGGSTRVSPMNRPTCLRINRIRYDPCPPNSTNSDMKFLYL